MDQKKKRGRKRKTETTSSINTEEHIQFSKDKVSDGEKISFGGLEILVSKEPDTAPLYIPQDRCEIEIEDFKEPITLERKTLKQKLLDEDKIVHVLKEFYNCTEKNWPRSSKYLCWWCSHSFTGSPKCIPTQHIGNKYKVYGNFCTWACVHAYIKKENLNSRPFQELISDIHGCEITIPVAPPRTLLKAFGGPMNIEEYRKNLNVYEINRPSIVYDNDMYLYKLSNKDII